MKINKSSWSILILVIVAIVIAIFSYYTIWLDDDINYMFSFVDGRRNEIISSFSDIIESQNVHYMVMNGRYVPHCIVQAFCGMWGHLPFAISNGIFYILFFLILSKLCGVKLSNIKGVLTIVLLGLLTFQTRMVPSFQIGYIWMFTLMMIFIYLFFYDDNGSWTWWKMVCAGIFSLIAGNGQESLSVGLGVALIVYWMKNMRRMSLAQYVMMICFGISAILCCIAPGTLHRATVETDSFNLSSIKPKIIFFVYICRAFYFLLIVVIWRIIRYKESIKRIYLANDFYWNAWATLVIFYFVAGIMANRCMFGAELMALIIGVKMLPKRCLNAGWLSASFVLLVLFYILQAEYVKRTYYQFSQMKELYSKSTNGEIFIDIKQNDYLPYSTHFGPPLNEKNGKYFDECLHRYFNILYPGKNNCKMTPSFLKGKENVDLGNQLVKMFDNQYLAIQSKDNPKQFYVNRSLNIPPFIKREYPPYEVKFTENKAVWEGEHWRAVIICKRDYYIAISCLNDFSVEMK